MFFILLNQFYILFIIKSNNFKRDFFVIGKSTSIDTESGLYESKIGTHVRIKFLWGILQLLQELKKM